MKISKSFKIKGLVVSFALLLTLTPIGGFFYNIAYGYISSIVPGNATITINTGDTSTSSTAVTLTLSATNATLMAICNDSGFVGCDFETYNTSKSWTLTSGDGVKTVYALYKSSTGDIGSATSDTITLSTPAASGGGGGGAAAAPAATTTTTTPAAAPAATTTTTTPAAAPAATTTTTSVVTTPGDVNTILNTFSIARNTATEATYSPLVTSDFKTYGVTGTTEQKQAVTNFVAYGISNATIKLGAGERRALARDYLETVGRAEFIWSDVEKMANGQKVVNRNLAKEQAQVSKVLATFKTLVGHAPDFKNAKEDLAWNTMMYRIRFTRDLAKEKVGILEFKEKFGVNPTTPLGWSTVRAWGYILQ